MERTDHMLCLVSVNLVMWRPADAVNGVLLSKYHHSLMCPQIRDVSVEQIVHKEVAGVINGEAMCLEQHKGK
jgi:hypothetical protein